jgi:thiol-disulfide isomerase/thioredoxin
MYLSTFVLLLATTFLQDASLTDPSIDDLVAKIRKLDFPDVKAVKEAGQDYNVELEKFKRDLDASVRLLAEKAPEHPELPGCLIRRWAYCDTVIVAGRLPVRPEYWIPDIEKIRNLPLSAEAIEACDYVMAYRKGWAEIERGRSPGKIANDFLKKYPKSQYIGKLLMDLVAKCTRRDDSLDLLDAWLATYPEQTMERTNVEARRRLWGHVGETIELKFQDELGGGEFDLKEHRGEVVVIEFWSTTCPPCVHLMREIKAMQQSSEFEGMIVVGIAQDAGDDGRRAMKKLLEKEGISWPQYFQDSAWDGPFSTEMGIRRLPTTLLVGKDGIVRPICERHMLKREIAALLKE